MAEHLTKEGQDAAVGLVNAISALMSPWTNPIGAVSGIANFVGNNLPLRDKPVFRSNSQDSSSAFTSDSSSQFNPNNISIIGNSQPAQTTAPAVEQPAVATVPEVQQSNPQDVVTYTYKPGDTFGQVLLDLGLSDGSNLWGPDGDVAYYTNQLASQGALDSRGNIPAGTTISLLKRAQGIPKAPNPGALR